ncbi:sulfotransferase [Gemmatimonadota bacterium]
MHFCITGTGRCGSKLLRNLFHIHPALFVYDETHWIPKMYEFFGTGEAEVEALINIIRRTNHVTGLPVTELDEARLATDLAGATRMTVAQFCDVLGKSFAQKEGKTLWADKTPDYGPNLQVLQTLWPNCRFVHIVRHGLEVALSMSRHPGFRWMASAQEMWWCPPSFNRYYQAVDTVERPFADFLDLWYRRFQRIRNESTRLHPDSYLEVRFEDLIAAPEGTLTKIAAFVDVAAPEDWVSEALSLIDVRRIRSHAREIEGGNIHPRHRELLTSLGYDWTTQAG